jgi:tetratricopeptide (TPR) repeat protein
LVAISTAGFRVATGAAEDAASRRAKVLHEEATKQYDLGEFDQALQSYKAAYLEKPDPIFLFNIGQCYRMKGNPDEAVAAYKTYLRKRPDAASRATVEQLVAEAERAIAQRKAPPAGTLAPTDLRTLPPAEVRPTAQSGAKPSEHESVPRATRKKWWIIGATIGGLTVLGLAVGLGVGLSGSGADVATAPNVPSVSLSF